jgi:beta-glucosidase
MYPFGYGLSYTTFEYSSLAIDRSTLGKDQEANVTFKLTNTGQRRGAEVVQLYVSFPGSAISHRPTRKLVGFDRIELEPGETKTVTLPLRHELLAYYNEAGHTFDVEAGTVNIYVSASSADDRLTGTITAQAATVKTTYLSDGTGIQDITAATAAQSKSAKVFNLQGVCVGTVDRFDTLSRGLYIVNGQKVIKR